MTNRIKNPWLPRAEIKMLLLEGISDTAVGTLRGAGFASIDHRRAALDKDVLIDALQDVRVLGIRSRTHLTADIIEATDSLIAIGCFSVGFNQVDLKAAQAKGIPVFNAPFSNTRSVAELTMAEIVMLYRQIFPRSNAAHEGGWRKSAQGSREVRGRTLGIVGYGNIGTQLSMLAESMGMRVIYYDHSDKLRHGNVEPMESLDALLREADVVSLHVPETPATKDMITEREIGLMRPGAYLINNSRGTVVDLEALAAALRDGHLAGAAVDVFPVEPSSNNEPFETPLQGLDNVILTPHVGGSTEEAQDRIGEEVARKLIAYADVGATLGAVNFPEVQLPRRLPGTRFLQVHRNKPGELGRLNEVLANRNVNIAGQYLQTDSEIGYVVLDADGEVKDSESVVEDIRALPGTIRARMLKPENG